MQHQQIAGLARHFFDIVKALFQSARSETELFRVWEKKLLEISESSSMIPRAKQLLSMIKASKAWTDFQDAARKRCSGGAELKVLEQLRFGDLFALIMIFGGHEFNKGPLEWNWGSIGKQGLQTATLMLSAASMQRFTNESLRTKTSTAKNPKNVYNSLKLEEMRKQMIRHVSYYLIEVRKKKAMGLIDLCVYLGIHEKLLTHFMSTDFVTQLVGYAANNIKHPPKEWYLGNTFILHPGSYACGTRYEGPYKIEMGQPMEQQSLIWTDGICVQQSGITETLKQAKFLESLSGRTLNEQLTMMRCSQQDDTIKAFLAARKELETEAEEATRQRMHADKIRRKALLDEQESRRRVRLLESQEQRIEEERIELVRVETEKIEAQIDKTPTLIKMRRDY